MIVDDIGGLVGPISDDADDHSPVVVNLTLGGSTLGNM